MKRTVILGLLALTLGILPACEKDPTGSDTVTDQGTDQPTQKDCPPGFIGNKCEYCAPGYYGSECTPCNCANGTCNDGMTGNGSCNCSSGYRGSTCAVACMGGATNPCNGNGLCLDDGSCQCNDGIKGIDCSGCDGNFTHSPACDRCVAGFFGQNCDKQCPGQGTDGGICSGHGTCSDGVDGTGVCSCQTGFAGENCEKCADGYRGQNCEIECAGGANNPCNGNGICGDDGTCECYNGFKGPNCSIECAGGHEKPCGGSENGTCLDDGSCQCKNGIKGSDCSGCEEHKTNYPSCDQCDVNYYGSNCQNACPGVGTAEGICNGHGTCDDGVNGKGTCTCTKGYDDASNCTRCADGYRGSNCSIECKGGAANPCNGHGTCKDDGSCSCSSGWEGDACETEVQTSCNFGYAFVDDARFTEQLGPTYCGGPINTPCNNHGTCNTTTQTCVCDSGYSDFDCGFNYCGRIENPCNGNGECDDTNKKCNCSKGYTGQYCETKINKSISSKYSIIEMQFELSGITKASSAEDAEDIAGEVDDVAVYGKQESMDLSARVQGGETSYKIDYPWLRSDGANSDGTHYTDDTSIGLFPRGKIWKNSEEPTRCFEVPAGDNTVVRNYSQEDAYDLYKRIIELTTGHTLNETADRRNVLGIRGAYPGTFAFHGNHPNRYNDTIVLLWKDSSSIKHVMEFPASTDPGAYQFGDNESDALLPNRQYSYLNGKHKYDKPEEFDALRINQTDYYAYSDKNKNGFLDSKRNGVYNHLPAGSVTNGNDYSSKGDDQLVQSGAHNIHYGRVIGSTSTLYTLNVASWSAGCQVIPGKENWQSFIDNAWTDDDPSDSNYKWVDYYLVDARDIDKRVWGECTQNGTHECPYVIEFNKDGVYTKSGSTSAQGAVNKFDRYYCTNISVASSRATQWWEKGAEQVYVFTVQDKGNWKDTDSKKLSIKITSADGVDVDAHLLYSDDAHACLTRADTAISDVVVHPGRYYIVVDTYSEADGSGAKPGAYTLSVTLK